MTLPNFLIIGTARAGTTSLFRYMAQHPEVYMPAVKEPKFFCFEGGLPNWVGPGDAEAVATYRYTSLHEYAKLFEHTGKATAVGEATPWYLYSPRAAQGIRKHIPSAKLICILRDPVLRAYSNFLINRKTGREPEECFVAALRREPSRIKEQWGWTFHYANRGLYAKQLSVYHALFPSAQIRVVSFDQFVLRTAAVVAELFDFLGVDSGVRVDVHRRHHRSTHETLKQRLMQAFGMKRRLHGADAQLLRMLPSEAQEVLDEFFAEDLRELRSLFPGDAPSWCRNQSS